MASQARSTSPVPRWRQAPLSAPRRVPSIRASADRTNGTSAANASSPQQGKPRSASGRRLGRTNPPAASRKKYLPPWWPQRILTIRSVASGEPTTMPRRLDPHPMGLAVARRIAKLRTEQGMTLGRLSLESGVSKGHLSNIERGLAVITVATLDTIARGLGIEVFYLLVFPQKSIRDQCVQRLRGLKAQELKAILARLPRPKLPRRLTDQRRD